MTGLPDTGPPKRRSWGRIDRGIAFCYFIAVAQVWNAKDRWEENKTTQGEKPNMDIRYSANQRDVKRCTTQELRDEFLIQSLYQPDSAQTVPAREVR